MIRGIGTDIVEIARIRQLLERHDRAFIQRVFTPEEQALAAAENANAAQFYAGRWAAKEAAAKTLGTGIGAECGWLDLRILRGPAGQPQLELHGAAAESAKRLGIATIHITISHTKELAVACAVAE